MEISEKRINLVFYYSGLRGQSIHYLPALHSFTDPASKPSHFYEKKWTAVTKHIQTHANQRNLSIYSGSKEPELNSDRYIVILFMDMRALSEKGFLDNLIAKFRPTAGPERNLTPSEIGKRNPFHYQPLITLGFKDIFSLFSEESHTLYLENKLLYDLHPDPRFKFLDSSIWNRYVPLYPKQGSFRYDQEPFDQLFLKVLDMMIANHEDNIYATVPARSYLEFHSRMLLNSFIAEVGRKGHHETVTPFKFHSEAQMAQKTAGLLDFFNRRRPNGLTLRDSISWKGLFVDDYADENTILSTFTDDDELELNEWTCPKNKLNIIQDLISSLGLKISIVPPGAKDSRHIIDESCKKLEKEVFDILLVDYLLGYTDLPGTGREYGHEFLRAIMEKSYRGRDYFLKRGPIGKFWIFPTSSFPLAFVDKMRQLGLTSIGEYFYLSNGGDPISTPEMFKFNLVYFLKQQVEQVYVTDDALAEFLSNYATIEDFNYWKNAILPGLNYFFSRSLILEGDQRNASSLAKSLRAIIDEDNPKLQHFKEDLEKQLYDIEDPADYGWVKPFRELYKKYPSLIKSIGILFRKLVYFNQASAIAENTGKNHFARKKLWYFEPDFDSFREHYDLNLLGNQLRDLPAEMSKMSNLEELILDNNQFERLPQVLKTLPNLKKLSIKGNPVAQDLGKDYFDNRQAIESLGKNNRWWHPDHLLKVYILSARSDLIWKNRIIEHLRLNKDFEIFNFNLEIVEFQGIDIETQIPEILNDPNACLIVLTSQHYLKLHPEECRAIENRLNRSSFPNLLLIDIDEDGRQFLSRRRPPISSEPPLAKAVEPNEIIFDLLQAYLREIHQNWAERAGWSIRAESAFNPGRLTAIIVQSASDYEDNSNYFPDVWAMQHHFELSGCPIHRIHIQQGASVDFRSLRSLPEAYQKNRLDRPEVLVVFLGGYRIAEPDIDGEYQLLPDSNHGGSKITSSGELREIINAFNAPNTLFFLNGQLEMPTPGNLHGPSSPAGQVNTIKDLWEKITGVDPQKHFYGFFSLIDEEKSGRPDMLTPFMDCFFVAITSLRKKGLDIDTRSLEEKIKDILNTRAPNNYPLNFYPLGNDRFVFCR